MEREGGFRTKQLTEQQCQSRRVSLRVAQQQSDISRWCIIRLSVMAKNLASFSVSGNSEGKVKPLTDISALRLLVTETMAPGAKARFSKLRPSQCHIDETAFAFLLCFLR